MRHEADIKDQPHVDGDDYTFEATAAPDQRTEHQKWIDRWITPDLRRAAELADISTVLRRMAAELERIRRVVESIGGRATL